MRNPFLISTLAILLILPAYSLPLVREDSLFVLLKNATSDSIKMRLHNELSGAWASKDSKKAMNHAYAALQLAEKLKDTKGQISSRMNLANAFFFQNASDSCRYHYHKALDICKDPRLISYIHSGLGQLNYYEGNYNQAVQQYHKAIEESARAYCPECAAVAYNYLGQVHAAQKLWDDAARDYQRALKIHQSTNNAFGEAQTLNSIANLLHAQGKYPEALVEYKKALRIMEKLEKLQSIATITSNIGAIYGELKQLDLALTYFLEGLRVMQRAKDSSGIASALSNVGLVFLYEKNYPKALEYLHQSLDIAGRLRSKPLLQSIYLDLASVYREKGDYRNAYLFHEKYSGIRDSLLNDENSRVIAEMNARFDLKNKEHDILRKESQLKEEKLESEKRKTERNALFVGLSLVVLLAVAIIRAYMQKKRASDLISMQKMQVEKQKQLLEEKQKEILDSIHYAKRIQHALLPNQKHLQKAIERLTKEK